MSLLSGLSADTPLGRVVAIRMEKDPKIIKKFGEWEKRIRSDWARFKSQHHGRNFSQAQGTAHGKTAQDVFKELFGKN